MMNDNGSVDVDGILERITIDPDQCGGRPCVRSMRIRVQDVIELVTSGYGTADIVAELPDLVEDDVEACLQFVCRSWLSSQQAFGVNE